MPSSRQLAWLVVSEATKVTPKERELLERLRQDEQFKQTDNLAKRFVQMVREHNATGLDQWLAECCVSELAALRAFGQTLKQDEAAVRAGITETWSNGQVEGQITRVKMVKRQMYGRASFELLRRRVLDAA